MDLKYIGKVFVSLAILVLVGTLGAAHGSRGRRARVPDLNDVVAGLCLQGPAGDFHPEDVPVFPGSRGLSLPAGGAGNIHISSSPAPVRTVRSFYAGAFSRRGWREVRSDRPDAKGLQDVLWFEKDGRQCLAGFSPGKEGGAYVVIVAR